MKTEKHYQESYYEDNVKCNNKAGSNSDGNKIMAEHNTEYIQGDARRMKII